MPVKVCRRLGDDSLVRSSRPVVFEQLHAPARPDPHEHDPDDDRDQDDDQGPIGGALEGLASSVECVRHAISVGERMSFVTISGYGSI